MKRQEPQEEYGVIYARYSSHKQNDESIEQQVAECTAYAEANNIRIIKVYDDHAVSGRSDSRLAFQRMLRDAARREFSVVIAYKSNRIGRNMLQALQNEDKLAKYGARVLYAKETFGDNAAGRFALRTMMNVNQFYSENLSEDVLRGMMDLASKGKVLGMLPLGYRKGADGCYEIDPNTAPLVQSIFQKYAHGERAVDILQWLNSTGQRTASNSEWNRNSLRSILKNQKYIGVYSFNGYEKRDGIPRIIDNDLWEQVQKQMQSNKKAPQRGRAQEEYVLSGKCTCGHCGSPIIGICGTSKTGAVHRYYQCNKNQRSCGKKNVRKDWLEELIADETRRYLLSPERIDYIAKICAEISKEDIEKQFGSVLPQLQRRLADNERATQNMIAAIEQGIITPTTKDRLLELEKQHDYLTSQIKSFTSIKKDTSAERIKYVLHKFSDDTAGSDRAADVIRCMVARVTLYDDRAVVYYNILDKNTPLWSEVPFNSPFDPNDPEKGGYKKVRLPLKQGHQLKYIRTISLKKWFGFFDHLNFLCNNKVYYE